MNQLLILILRLKSLIIVQLQYERYQFCSRNAGNENHLPSKENHLNLDWQFLWLDAYNRKSVKLEIIEGKSGQKFFRIIVSTTFLILYYYNEFVYSYTNLANSTISPEFLSRKMLIHLCAHWMNSLRNWLKKILNKNWTFKVYTILHSIKII
jgi:hypothetical protein